MSRRHNLPGGSSGAEYDGASGDSRTPLSASGTNAGSGPRGLDGIAGRNPLGFIAGALAVGFLAGSVLPGTRFEDQQMGEAAEKAKEQLRGVGGDLLDRGKDAVQEVAQAAIGAASETAKKSGASLVDDTTKMVRSGGSSNGGSH